MKKSYEMIAELVERRGWSFYRLSMESQVPQSTFSLWKTKGIVPKVERMMRIAEALSTPERKVDVKDIYAIDLVK